MLESHFQKAMKVKKNLERLKSEVKVNRKVKISWKSNFQKAMKVKKKIQ